VAERFYGVLAEFETPDALVDAAKRAREEGYRQLDAFTPFPIEELRDIFEFRDRRVLWAGLAGGCFGFAFALLMQLFVSFDYPLNVGGKPVYALTAFAVVAFELTILFAALFPALAMLWFNGLPRLNHPVFGATRFHLASNDRFFLCVKGEDAKFDPARTQRYLKSLKAASVELVPL
jgi:hypothetical protein